MARANINGVELFYEMSGTGDIPLVVVHGSWSSHHSWDVVAPRLAKSFRVLTYDRRGHSESDRPREQGSVREDVADVAELIEHFGMAPAWVAGNSFGAAITLRLAGERPDLLRGIVAHEPSLFSLLADDPSVSPLLDDVRKRVAAVVERIASGDDAGAAEQFVETVGLGPGSWARLPPNLQQTFITNAPTYLDECRDPEQLAFDLAWIASFARPSLLTWGDQSPPTFAPVIEKLAAVMPNVTVAKFTGAGHMPHVTHADAYVETVTTFIHKHSA